MSKIIDEMISHIGVGPNLDMPKFTIYYNIVNGSRWIGTAWEFFDGRNDAELAHKRISAAGHCATLRSFHMKCDSPHLGACHREAVKEAQKGNVYEQSKSTVTKKEV